MSILGKLLVTPSRRMLSVAASIFALWKFSRLRPDEGNEALPFRMGPILFCESISLEIIALRTDLSDNLVR